MLRPFFPNEAFGVIYFLIAIGMLLWIASKDLREYRIPNALTVPTAILGLMFNAVRGGWLGSMGLDVWLTREPGTVLGVVDGVGFSLAGFALGFGLYLLIWLLKACKGGDVKLAAAIGAWLGPFNVILFVPVTVVMVMVFLLLKLLTGGFSLRAVERNMKQLSGRKSMTGNEAQKYARRGLAFSLPSACAAAIVMLWAFRYDFKLM